MENVTQQLDEKINIPTRIDSAVQHLAQKMNMSFDEFVGEMRKRGCSEPTATKIWRGEYETYTNFNDNDMSLSNLRKAADVLKVVTGSLFPEVRAETTMSVGLLVADQNYMLIKSKDAGAVYSSGEKKHEYKIQH